ncbi:MAG: hypothetical protein JO001_25475 [Alphaproteobacteria bacterium]|nr:hypothetical protein [Alphaproteobacteria bacterium]
MTQTAAVAGERLWIEVHEAPPDHLPEVIPQLSPEQAAEAQARDEQYRREWQAINKALRDNAMAVTRAMSLVQRAG